MVVHELSVTRELTGVNEKDISDFDVETYVLKDKVLFSQGKWKDYYYGPQAFNKAYEQTDFTDSQVRALFLDHYDGTPDSVAGFLRGGAATWIGTVENIRKQGKDLIGDLHIVDKNVANKLAYILNNGEKKTWGVSAKVNVDYDEEQQAVKNYTYKNFSIVVEPAVKTAYINNSQAEENMKGFVKALAKEVVALSEHDTKTEKEAKNSMADKKKKEDEEEEKTEETSENTEEQEQPAKELSDEQVSELEKAAKLVLEFVAKQKQEHSEEEPKEEEDKTEDEDKEEEEETKEEESEEKPKEPEGEEEPAEEKTEEPKEEPKEEEHTKQKKKVENSAKQEDQKNLEKTVQELSAKLAKLEEKEKGSVENVQTSTASDEGKLTQTSNVDVSFCKYLEKFAKD